MKLTWKYAAAAVAAGLLATLPKGGDAWAAGEGETRGSADIACAFHQVKKLKVSKKTIESAGELTFTAPDRLSMRYTQPEGDFFLIDGMTMRMKLGKVSQKLDTRKNKGADAQRRSLLYALSGRYRDIAEEMNGTVTETEVDGNRHVVIVLRRPLPRSYSRMELDYRKQDGLLIRMALTEPGGIVTEYALCTP